MSKHSRKKLPPFNALNLWIKHYDDTPRHCILCKEKAVYALEEWLFSHIQIAPDPQNNSGLLDRLWSEAIRNQMTGKYKKAATIYECEECTFNTISHLVGKEPATLTFIANKIIPWMSIIIGVKVESPQDEGHNFISNIHDNLSVEELGQRMNDGEKIIDIHMKDEVQG
jgi:hypothetical protein